MSFKKSKKCLLLVALLEKCLHDCGFVSVSPASVIHISLFCFFSHIQTKAFDANSLANELLEWHDKLG